MKSTIEGLLAHRSVRQFTSRTISDRELHRWIQCGQAASTSSHVQATSVIRVSDRVQREELVQLTGGQEQVLEAAIFLVICADARRHRLLAASAGRATVENFETFLVGVIDASLFAQNVVIAAESEGFGICYIGGLRTRISEVDALLEIPEGIFPLYGLCIGEPAEIPAIKPRLPVEAVLFEERVPGDGELLRRMESHDVAMAEYYSSRGLTGRNWSGGVLRKLSKPHRVELPRYYKGKGASFAGE